MLRLIEEVVNDFITFGIGTNNAGSASPSSAERQSWGPGASGPLKIAIPGSMNLWFRGPDPVGPVRTDPNPAGPVRGPRGRSRGCPGIPRIGPAGAPKQPPMTRDRDKERNFIHFGFETGVVGFWGG